MFFIFKKKIEFERGEIPAFLCDFAVKYCKNMALKKIKNIFKKSLHYTGVVIIILDDAIVR